jgi:hypothetical protein
VAANAASGAANAIPVSRPTGNMAIDWYEKVAPNAAITTR